MSEEQSNTREDIGTHNALSIEHSASTGMFIDQIFHSISQKLSWESMAQKSKSVWLWLDSITTLSSTRSSQKWCLLVWLYQEKDFYSLDSTKHHLIRRAHRSIKRELICICLSYSSQCSSLFAPAISENEGLFNKCCENLLTIWNNTLRTSITSLDG